MQATNCLPSSLLFSGLFSGGTVSCNKWFIGKYEYNDPCFYGKWRTSINITESSVQAQAVTNVKCQMSKIFIGGAVCREFESEALITHSKVSGRQFHSSTTTTVLTMRKLFTTTSWCKLLVELQTVSSDWVMMLTIWRTDLIQSLLCLLVFYTSSQLSISMPRNLLHYVTDLQSYVLRNIHTYVYSPLRYRYKT